MDHRLLSCFSQRIKRALSSIDADLMDQVEEVRIRINQPVELIVDQHSYFLMETGKLSPSAESALVATAEDGQKILNLISRHSLYAVEEELKQGYITIAGGHRVGIAGRVVLDRGKVHHVKHIRFFNFRIARDVPGVAQSVVPYIVKNGEPLNTLIISPPRCGKTTLLRDIVRIYSYGGHGVKSGLTVGVVDERSEIASCLEGLPQFDLGPRADILDACPKAEGMMMMIRSMSPRVIACDEIGSREDVGAILEASHAGVAVLATAHGYHIEDIKKRPQLASLFTPAVFQRYIILSRRNGAGTIEALMDGEGNHLYPRCLESA